MEGPSGIVQQQDTLNRYLLYFPRGTSFLPDVHSFTGEEELSKPYRYTIRFTSPASNIAVNDVLNQRAEFILRAPNPKADWHNQEPWLPVRQINGVITSFARLKSSADTGLSRTEKYPLLEVLDEKKAVPDRLDLEMSLGEHSAGYVWLMLALASDAVMYAQGDQLVAASEQNRFSMTALSSLLTRQPDYPQEKRYTTPWEVCGIAGLMFFFGIMITIGSFGDGGKSISGWFLITMGVLCIVIFCSMGAFFTWFYGDKAREHMGV